MALLSWTNRFSKPKARQPGQVAQPLPIQAAQMTAGDALLAASQAMQQAYTVSYGPSTLTWSDLVEVLDAPKKPPLPRSYVCLTGAKRVRAAPIGKVTQHYSVEKDEYYAIDSANQRFTLNRDTMEWTLCTTP